MRHWSRKFSSVYVAFVFMLYGRTYILFSRNNRVFRKGLPLYNSLKLAVKVMQSIDIQKAVLLSRQKKTCILLVNILFL